MTLQAKLDAFRARLLNKQTAAEFGISESYFPESSPQDCAQDAQLADMVRAGWLRNAAIGHGRSGFANLTRRRMSMINSRTSGKLGAANERLQLSSQKDIVARGTCSRSTGGQDPVVFIIDDDPSIGEALHNLFRSVGLRAEVFGSVAELMGNKLPDVASCLVLDVRLPGLSGLDFQDQLTHANIHVPIIFMTGHGDIPMTVRAMKAGAVDFLTKPFRDQDMLDAIAMAIARDRMRRDGEKLGAEMHARFGALSPREREVMALVTSGLMNKQVAAKTGLAEATVKIHRGHVMRKMGVKSLADLVRTAELIGVRLTNSDIRPSVGRMRSTALMGEPRATRHPGAPKQL